MTKSIILECNIHFRRRGRGSRKEICGGESPSAAPRVSGRVPRISRFTVRWRNRVLQLPCEATEFMQSGSRVTVCEPLEGQLRIFASEREILWSPIVSPPLPKPPKRTGPTGSNQGQKPAANHPWRNRAIVAIEPPITPIR
jgi:hypothetical protein